jgi:hypothetical protein
MAVLPLPSPHGQPGHGVDNGLRVDSGSMQLLGGSTGSRTCAYRQVFERDPRAARREGFEDRCGEAAFRVVVFGDNDPAVGHPESGGDRVRVDRLHRVGVDDPYPVPCGGR